jgi:hypothetical protein
MEDIKFFYFSDDGQKPPFGGKRSSFQGKTRLLPAFSGLGFGG